MHPRIALLLFVLCTAAPAGAAVYSFSSEKRPVRTLTIDSGYVPQLGTNRSTWNTWMEWEGLGGALFDGLSDNTFVGQYFPTRLLWAGLFLGGWYFVDYTFFVANHEMGHGARATAAGLSPTFSWTPGWTLHTSIFGLVGEGFFHYGQGAVTTSGGAARAFPTDWATVITAAGMNNSQLFAEHLEDAAGRDAGHITQGVAYFRAKTDPFFYSQATASGAVGDVSNLLSFWSSRGYGIANSDVGNGGAISFLGSFTTYAYAWSILRYIGIGDATVRPFRIGPVRLPDLSFFQSPFGISYRVRTDIGEGGFFVPLSVEFVTKGRFVAEISGGVSIWGTDSSRNGFQAKAYVNTLGGFGLETFKEFALGPHFMIAGGTGIFTTASLQGQRGLDYLLNDTFGLQGWARLGWVF